MIHIQIKDIKHLKELLDLISSRRDIFTDDVVTLSVKHKLEVEKVFNRYLVYDMKASSLLDTNTAQYQDFKIYFCAYVSDNEIFISDKILV